MGSHPDRIKNLLFAVNILWKAFNRIADQLIDFEFKSGNFLEEQSSKFWLNQLILQLQNLKDLYFQQNIIFGKVATQR